MSGFLKTGGGVLDSGPTQDTSSIDHNFPDVGQTIGGFELTRCLSKTDFSTVFEAVKVTDTVTQTVAIKIMSARYLNPTIVPLFEREKALLASLSHPAIAAFIDAGMSSDGYSYIVMERIWGQDILSYCNQKRLSVRQRVLLLIDVMKVVKFAHARLVIHNDLKPSNILVTDDGYIKLLDFGISKLIGEHSAEGSNKRFFTPQYAAPEQINQVRTTVATDIYQLGVVLYRLVSGLSPYSNQSDELGDICQAILSESIQAPGLKYRSLKSIFRKRKIALQRKGKVADLARQIGIDLDRVILHSLNKSPDARYPMIDNFQQDLQYWLEQKPISLATEWHYRLGLYIKRHAMALGIATTSICTLAVSTLLYLQNINTQRLKTAEQAQYAQAVSDFLLATLLDVNGKLDNFDELTLTQVIENANNTLNNSENLPDAVRRELALLLVNANSRTQNFQAAKQIIENHTPVLQHLAMPVLPDPALAIKYAEVLYDVGDYDSAWQLVLKLLGELSQTAYPLNYDVSKLAAEILRKLQRYDEALKYALEAYAFMNENTQTVGKPILNLLGGIYLNLGQYNEAIGYFEKGLEQTKSAGETLSFRDIVLQGNLAILYDIVGDQSRASQHITEAIEQTETFFPNRYSSLASFYNTYGSVLKNQQHIAEAIERVRQAIALYESHFGNDYPKLISPYSNLREWSVLAGNCDEAEFANQRLQQLQKAQDAVPKTFVCESQSSSQKVY